MANTSYDSLSSSHLVILSENICLAWISFFWVVRSRRFLFTLSSWRWWSMCGCGVINKTRSAQNFGRKVRKVRIRRRQEQRRAQISSSLVLWMFFCLRHGHILTTHTRKAPNRVFKPSTLEIYGTESFSVSS